MRINLVERILVVLYENPEGTCGFSEKIAKVNRCIELCNLFPRIENQFSGIAIRSLDTNNSFSRIAIVYFEGMNCNLRKDCLIRGNELPIRGNEILIRVN